MKKIETFTLDETRFLSNFYPHKKRGEKYPVDVTVTYNGIFYDCTENAYQAAKSLDPAVHELFSQMSPFETKKYWDDKKDQIRPDWDDVKYEILRDLNYQKFNNSEQLRQMLLDTGDAILEEGNTWGDVYWGISNGVGENRLGKLLMAIRDNYISFPALYKTKDGNLFKSNFVRKECELVGIFPFKEDKTALMTQTPTRMKTEEAIIYLKRMHSVNSITWRLLVYDEDVYKLREDFEERNNCLIKLGQNKLDDHLMDGFDYVTSYFITNEVLFDLTAEERAEMLLQILMFSEYKE